MIFLEQNIKGLCFKSGLDYHELLQDFNVDTAFELTIVDLESISEEYNLDLQALLFSPLFEQKVLADKLRKIKLLIIDVDGVMTDGGMYYTEQGDEIKKFNTKDGMAIMGLTKKHFPVGIISSGFSGEAIHKRAKILNIPFCHIGREPKMEILNRWCKDLAVNLKEVAIIGDDINDLEVMQHVGFSVCPSDAVPLVKGEVDLILSKKGGEGCVREFIDNYFNF